MKRVLEHVRVIDFTHAYAGPFLSLNLADFGADVIKIEKYGTGDQTRSWAPVRNGNSGYYASFNRGKKSLSIDMRTEAGRQIILDLAKNADIVCENFKAGSLERLGLGYEDMKQVNPEIIYASSSGYGTWGPYKKDACYDIVAQSMSGIMSTTGFPDTPPTKTGPSIGDNFAGLTLFYGVLMAYYHKLKTGKGQHLEVSMHDCLFAMLDKKIFALETGIEELRWGNHNIFVAPSNIYQIQNDYFYFAIETDTAWTAFVEKSNLSVLEQEIFATAESRIANEAHLNSILEECFATLTEEECNEICKNTGAYYTTIFGIDDVCSFEQLLERDMILDIDDPSVGSLKVVGNPMKLSDMPPVIDKPSPFLGEDSYAVLQELGYDTDYIHSLVEQKVIFCHEE